MATERKASLEAASPAWFPMRGSCHSELPLRKALLGVLFIVLAFFSPAAVFSNFLQFLLPTHFKIRKKKILKNGGEIRYVRK